MVSERLKYVTARPSLENPKRWYWQRPGYPLTRLPSDLVKRVAMVEELNQEAEGRRGAEGSVAWVVQTYQEGEYYAALAPGTKKYYDRLLREIEAVARHKPFAMVWTRKVVVEFIKTYKKGLQKQVGAVLRNLFNVAIYHGHGVENQARELRIRGGKARTQLFTPDEAKSWLEACGDDDAMRLAFTMLRYTVQRPNDVLTMNWSQYDGDLIKLRQQKTKKLVDVPCHVQLRSALDQAKEKRDHTRIVANGFRGLSYTRFCVRFRRIANAAGLPKHQARDLRRTAAVMMSEAGATVQQIAAIAGWTIKYTTQILDTYIPLNVEMARGGVLKWEQKDSGV